MTRSSLCLLALVALAGCPAPSSTAALAPTAIEVTTAAPARRDVTRELVLPVELWAWQRVAIVAKVTGYVSKVSVDRGSAVKAGELLATVTAPELEDERRKRAADVNVARAEVQSAVADLDLQSVTAARMVALVRDRAVSVQEADEAKAREVVAKAHIDQANAKLAAAQEELHATETWLAYTTIAAPFEGIVTDRWVHPGAFVSGAEKTPLFELVDRSTIRAVVDVPEANAPALRVGKTAVAIHIPELGGPRQGTITRAAASLDARTRTLRLEVDLENAKGDLIPGMYGRAVFELERHEDVLTIPATAVARANGEVSAFVAREGAAVRRAIKVGLEDEKVVEVLGGLEAQDAVIVQARGLSEGARVKVLPAK